MIVTEDFLETGKTPRGSWRFAQLALLGVPWPPVKGWKRKVIGMEISAAEAAAFVGGAIVQVSKKERKELRRKTQVPGYRGEFKAEIEALERQAKAQAARSQRSEAFLARVADGPVDPASNAFLKTYAWRQLRMLTLKKYGVRCQCCGATPDEGEPINVDHIKPRRVFPHLALDPSNLQVLCAPCNQGKGNWDHTDWRSDEVPFDPADDFKARLRIVT